MGNIIGLAKLMKRDITDEGLRSDLDNIIRDADRCGRIIKDLLLYSRQSPPRKERVSLTYLIRESVDSAKKMLDSKRIKIQVDDVEDGIPDINVDPLQISQVIHNLIKNSIQAIEDEGVITVKTAMVKSTPKSLKLLGETVKDGWVEISISDTGCGIDDKIKDKIFYPFFTTKKVGEGTGLGLAISYSIIQNHGGDITVESHKGKGSKFTIRLPID